MTKKEKIQKILISDANFNIQNESFCFLPGDRIPHCTAGPGLLGSVQAYLKTYGKLYYSLLNLFGPVLFSLAFRRAIRDCLDNFSEDHIIINLGSGPQHFHGRKDIINIDVFAFDEVDIVADACDLPIEDQSVDFVINIAMLEHVDNPGAVINEICRILKPEGEVLAYAPFMQPYHAAPTDYYRWTHQGLKELFSSFDAINVFVGCGPTSGMLYVLEEWLATLFSFGSRTLHDVWFIKIKIKESHGNYCFRIFFQIFMYAFAGISDNKFVFFNMS
ncbi:class I SAM-dependent methyltransferase [Thermodesulfobacteriota bacterium]